VPICCASCQAIALESNCETESVELLMLDRILGLSAMLSLSWAAAHAEDCGHLARLKLDHVLITSAEAVPAGAPTASPNGDALPAAKAATRWPAPTTAFKRETRSMRVGH
jgi:hypothetical protein